MDHSCHYTAVMVLLIFWDVFADSVRALPSGRMMGDCGGQSFFGDNIPGRCREDFFCACFSVVFAIAYWQTASFCRKGIA